MTVEDHRLSLVWATTTLSPIGIKCFGQTQSYYSLRLSSTHHLHFTDLFHPRTFITGTEFPNSFRSIGQYIWKVDSSLGVNVYVVQFFPDCCQYRISCGKCRIGKVCRHMVSCTCEDYMNQHLCKHMHALIVQHPELLEVIPGISE